jgi:hypothetical protein
VSVDVKNLLKAVVGIGDDGEVNMWDLLSSGFLFFSFPLFHLPMSFFPTSVERPLAIGHSPPPTSPTLYHSLCAERVGHRMLLL